jgi:ketosteroid isomerase-like protein
MKTTIILFLGAILLLQSDCILVGREAKENLKAIVEDLGDKAEQCFLSGNVDAMLQYYCDDVISMPNLHPMIRGKADLKRQTEAILVSGLKFASLESTTVDVQGSGDLVYEVGTFRQAILIPGTKEPLEQNGKYVNIWRRQPNGKLAIAVEIYNSDTDPNARKTDQSTATSTGR